jgi:O-antigen/teichoic acid export membrane protein
MSAVDTEVADPVLADPDRAALHSRVLSGVIWKLASVGLSQVLNTGIYVLLARLLVPRQFGIAAMAMVASAFVITYSDCGLGLALVQSDTITEADRSTVFWASTALGAIMALVCIGVAPLVASFYRTPEVRPLLDVLSLSFFFTGLGSTPRSLQLRAMNFRLLEIRIMAAGIVGGVTTIILAVAGTGAWSIIWGDVASAGVSTCLLLALGRWRPRLIFKLSSLRRLSGFGLRYMGGATFTTLNTNADNVLVGGILGQVALGIYSFAYSVILVPMSRLALPVHQLLAPAFARLQNDRAALASSWLRGTRLLLMIFLPGMITVSVVAPDLVRIVFGDKWVGAIPVIRVLAPTCALMSVQGLADAALQAVGSMRTYLWMCALSFALNLVAFVVGIQWGLVGMATALGISTLSFMAGYLTITGLKIGSPPSALVRTLSGVCLASALLALVEVSVYSYLVDTSVGALPRALTTGVIGVAVFAATCYFIERDSLLELLRIAFKALRVPQRLVPAALSST